MSEEKFLTADEVAERYRRTPAGVQSLAKKGEIPSVRIGSRVLFPASALEAYERRQMQGVTDGKSD